MGNEIKILTRIIDRLFPGDSARRLIARSIYRGLIKNEKMKLIEESGYDNIRGHLDDIYANAYEKSPDYVPFEDSGFHLLDNDPKLLAFYLPQYYPFPENDSFWGKGFTEWNNTTRAIPFFRNHYQPRLPDELGFYDTRIKDVLKRQIEIAKMYGIYGFCFHHYWFNGKPLMRVPYNHIMANPDLDIPFCLHWANEPWSTGWDGFSSKEGLLLDQKHSPEDDIAFIKDIEPALRDRRYIRINGRPLLIIYRPGLFPDMRSTIKRWNDYTVACGIGQLFIAVMQTNFEGQMHPAEYDFDAAVEYPPHCYSPYLTNYYESVPLFYPNSFLNINSYPEIIQKCLSREKPEYNLFRGIMPGWDNSARRKNSLIFIDSTPDLYKKWLMEIIAYTKKNLEPDRQFIFINSWNEWAEGAYLEPDRRYGFAYLNASRQAITVSRNS